jgi:hypothetical protein
MLKTLFALLLLFDLVLVATGTVFTVPLLSAVATGAPSIAADVSIAAAHAASLSPDGTKSLAPDGGPLITAVGTWTWGTAAAGRPAEYNVNLNGKAAPGIGTEMVVSNGGKLFVNTLNSGWYIWDNGFSSSTAPTPPPPAPTGSGTGVTSVTGAGTVTCSPTTGAVKCTGSAVPGPAGPAGPIGETGPGPINRGEPVIGAQCHDGESLYMPDHSTDPPKVLMFLCDYPNLVWIGPFVIQPKLP